MITLDVKRIKGVIRQVSDYDPAVGSILGEYAGRFAYTAILNALEGRRAVVWGQAYDQQ